MNDALIVARSTAAIVGFAATAAFAQLDKGGENHYILECDDQCVVNGRIRPGFTGAWSDPDQSGQGLFIEVLPDNRIHVAWFTFNPQGTEQAWFTGVGIYSGNQATITEVTQPTGGRWVTSPTPAQVASNVWGSLILRFVDCNNGWVEFMSTRGYGVGAMRLVRLTQPAGSTCP